MDDEVQRKIVAGEYVPRFDYLANATKEVVMERELRYHSTGAPRGWRPDPRRRELPSGVAVRMSSDGRGCVTYVDGLMFWGTVEAVERAVLLWIGLPAWAKKVMKELDSPMRFC